MKIKDAQLNARYESGQDRLITEAFRTTISSFLNPLPTEKLIRIDNIEFDRNWSSKWNDVMRSRLIESLLFNIPVKPIILYKKLDCEHYKLVDGRERIEAIRQFYFNQLSLSGIQIYPELNGKIHSNIPYKLRNGINHRYLNFVSFFPISNNMSQTEMEKLINIAQRRLNLNNHDIS